MDARRPNPEVDEFEWVQRLREHGTAPQSWVTGMPDRLLQRLSEAGVPEVIEVGGHQEAWREAIARFANGHGNGDVNGRGNGLEQRGVTPEIVFSTIYEDGKGAAVPGSGANGETDS